MRIFLLLFFTYLLSFTLFAQIIPNGGFESWTNGIPDNWSTDNVASIYTPVTQSISKHSGSFSAMGSVINTVGGVVGPVIQAGSSATGFAVSQRFKTVSGYYQFNSMSGDKLVFNFFMYQGGFPIAGGSGIVTASSSAWLPFNVDFSYATGDIPDVCTLQFLIVGPVSGTDYHVGSYFLLDDIDISGTSTSVNDKNKIPAAYSLEQNFPNPFNPSTKITFSLPENSFVNLRVFNAIGLEVTSLINGVMPVGIHEVVFDASDLYSGVYFYTLKAGNFVQTRKMILIK